VSDGAVATREQGFVPGRHQIETYGDGGFRFADMSHRGSILALPSGIYATPLQQAAEINEAALERVLNAPKDTVELLIVGTGMDLLPIPSVLRAKLRSAGIMCETMATGAAVRTYNMLVEENRRVAALLIAV
jgi:uncharacterized protein